MNQFSVSRCCCTYCRSLFYDEFNRADGTTIGNNWTEVSGDWSLLSEHIRCLDSNSVLIHDPESIILPNGQTQTMNGGYTVNYQITISADDVPPAPVTGYPPPTPTIQHRMLFNYVDASNYSYVELGFENYVDNCRGPYANYPWVTLRLGTVSGGTDTVLSEGNKVMGHNLPLTFIMVVCVRPTCVRAYCWDNIPHPFGHSVYAMANIDIVQDSKFGFGYKQHDGIGYTLDTPHIIIYPLLALGNDEVSWYGLECECTDYPCGGFCGEVYPLGGEYSISISSDMTCSNPNSSILSGTYVLKPCEDESLFADFFCVSANIYQAYVSWCSPCQWSYTEYRYEFPFLDLFTEIYFRLNVIEGPKWQLFASTECSHQATYESDVQDSCVLSTTITLNKVSQIDSPYCVCTDYPSSITLSKV